MQHRRYSKGVIALVLAALNVLALVVFMRRNTQTDAQMSLRAKTGVPEQRARIDHIITTLKSETVHDSIAQLAEPEQYHYPGILSSRKFAQNNIEYLLSNRRSVKVVQQIGGLPPEDTQRACKELFEFAFGVHAMTINAAVDNELSPSPKENKQSARATLYAVCTSLLATAEIRPLQELVAHHEQVERFRQQTEQRMLDSPGLSRLFCSTVRNYLEPDLRFQLNLFRLHAIRSNRTEVQGIDALCEGYTRTMIPIVRWDAVTTWHDIPRRMEGIPIDASKGVSTYELLDWPAAISNDVPAQRQVVEKVAALLGATIHFRPPSG